ncbi:DEKNAAC102905 [Brettanomyces naardenensis]|uniref:DEKNAAC102905 n=1 Tax=Brettanomyces naardenensis TaxID=13370 RepID=A0A448YLV1_BRENA|nr:DEKNAAC102905 [Brettanomyces naardenensis]
MSFDDNLLYQDTSDNHHIDDTYSHLIEETVASNDHDGDEASIVGRALTAIVDIGSNGIRFSISSKAPHHARIMPCVFKDRLGISLFDAQLPDSATSTVRKPIPQDAIHEIIQAMKRFRWICEDFGVPSSGVKVVATEATREAPNCQEFIDTIYSATGWKVSLLSKEEEGRTGAYGVASSFHDISGLFMDMGGGSTQFSWIRATDGEMRISDHPVSLPFGAAALTRRMKYQDFAQLYGEIQEAFESALEKIDLPSELLDEAQINGGFRMFVCGGGFRGLGHLLLACEPDYPIQTIINGFSTTCDKVERMANYLLLKREPPRLNAKSNRIFRVSARREQQLPAVGLLVSAALESLPRIKTFHFSEGGVREGVLYSMIPDEIKLEDPLLTATRPYAPLLTERYWDLLRMGLPTTPGIVPDEVALRVVPALCNIAFVHCSYPKELQPTAALHVATTGIIAGAHGLSHKIRALIGMACCERWGGDIPPSEEDFYARLERLIMNADPEHGESLIYWTKYCGKMMHVICGIHPGGNIRPGSLVLQLRNVTTANDLAVSTANLGIADEGSDEDTATTTALESMDPSKIKYAVYVILPGDDIKYSYSVRNRIFNLQRKIRKLNKKYRCAGKVKVFVKYGNDDLASKG